MSRHREGINPGFLTKHRLVLRDLNNTNASQIITDLDQLPCMDGIWLNVKKQALKLAYDASHHNIDDMIGIIEQHGATVKKTWWSRVKLSWQRQIDQNIKDNAKHQPHCCSKSPR